jgi:GntR family transcriptional regulator/MocR family aminotransferase
MARRGSALTLRLHTGDDRSLHDRICDAIVEAIAADDLETGAPLPSCRDIATQLGVSRNTAQLAYTALCDRGLVSVRARSGYVVAGRDPSLRPPVTAAVSPSPMKWMSGRPSELVRVQHPPDWARFPYPFIYNQIDAGFFPVEAWRECSRAALGRRTMRDWTSESVDGDSVSLIRQIRRRLSAYRGIDATQDEILITPGAQGAIAITAALFSSRPGPIAIEDPGYPDARNAFIIMGNSVHAVPTDDDGLRVGEVPSATKLVYLTPSYQFPTSVTLALERRHDLLSRAQRDDFLLFEDDFEAEIRNPDRLPALRAIDRNQRVIYAGSFSKTLSPSLRLGFMVAHRDIIREARAIRLVLCRQVPTLIQETAALLLSRGHFDAHLRSLDIHLQERREAMMAAVAQYLPGFKLGPSKGGTALWLRGHKTLDSNLLKQRVLSNGVIIDSGDTFFLSGGPRPEFRLSFSAVSVGQIDAGVREIAAEV